MNEPRALTWSYGGGTQSIAIVILVCEGLLPKPELIVMADTGREATETWEYHERYVAPLMKQHGMVLEIAKASDLATVDLYAKNGDLLIPAYMADEDGDGEADGKLPTFCSTEWKARVFRRYVRAKGYGPARPIDTWLGFSADEQVRLKESDRDWQRFRWPLCFDVPLARDQCVGLITRFGLPPPPKSSCWMCPHRGNAQWKRLEDEYPADFQKAIELDRQVTDSHGVYLHKSGKPLAEADLTVVERDMGPLFGPSCNTGGCWT